MSTKAPDDEVFLQMCRDSLGAYAVAMDRNYQVPAHVDIMIQCAEKVVSGEWSRTLVNLPPRHSKTQTWSVNMPAWFLGKNPGSKVMVVTYGQDLADRIGGFIRGQLQDPLFQKIFPECRLSKSTNAKNNFQTTQKGEFLATTIGGQAGGFGADCVTGETLITTEAGEIKISDLHRMKRPPKVLSYCCITDEVVLRPIVASLERHGKETITIITDSGKVIECTPDHRIYCREGYIPAGNLRVGQQVKSLSQGSFDLSALHREFSDFSSQLKPQSRSREGCPGLQIKEMPCQHQDTSMRGLPNGSGDRGPQILQTVLEEKQQGHEAQAGRRSVSILSKAFQAVNSFNKTLFSRVRRQNSFEKNDWIGQFSLQRISQLCGLVQADEANNQRARWPQMHGLRFSGASDLLYQSGATCDQEQSNCSPHRRKQNEQQPAKSDYTLHSVSHKAPQIIYDTISEIKTDCRKTKSVYDIQVAGSHNFFGEKVCLSNCLIIDDPIKNAQDAYSPTIRQRVIEEYRSVFYPRLMPGGRICIILTRWHDGDLQGWLLDPDEQQKIQDWKMVVFPAIAERDEGWRKEGEALWPECFPIEVLEDIKTVKGDWDWASQYQQRPSAIEGFECKRAWWKYYDWAPTMVLDKSIKRLLTAPYQIYQVWDFASEDGQQHDYQVCQTWLSTFSGEYLLDVFRKKMIIADMDEKADELANIWRPDAILMEDVTGNKSVIQSMEKRKTWPIIRRKPQGPKHVRFRAVTPWIQAGRCFLPTQAPWLKDHLDEHTAFPTAAHDDQPDCTSCYLLWRMEQVRDDRDWGAQETYVSEVTHPFED